MAYASAMILLLLLLLLNATSISVRHMLHRHCRLRLSSFRKGREKGISFHLKICLLAEVRTASITDKRT